jgi:hypothetical protein
MDVNVGAACGITVNIRALLVPPLFVTVML